ncbi:MAG: hypothetical protein JWN04_5335 [Myxococcaceae bacterium]|nr:hypothetical protein [Myxococcaceae bacterium]
MKQQASSARLYAIYDCPRDHPDYVIVRGWCFAADGRLLPQPETLAFHVPALGRRGAVSAARKHCNRLGFSFIPRNWNDDPVIMETWTAPAK